MRNVMTKAWEIAKEGAAAFGGSSKLYFREALVMAWADHRSLKGTNKMIMKEIVSKPWETYRDTGMSFDEMKKHHMYQFLAENGWFSPHLMDPQGITLFRKEMLYNWQMDVILDYVEGKFCIKVTKGGITQDKYTINGQPFGYLQTTVKNTLKDIASTWNNL